MASRVGRDVAEHSVLDLVPLARSRKEVAHLEREREFICQLLDLTVPQANPVSIAASAVSLNEKLPGNGVDRLPHKQAGYIYTATYHLTGIILFQLGEEPYMRLSFRTWPR